MQPGGVGTEAGDRGQRHRRGDLVEPGRQGVQGAAQTVVVQQRTGRPEPLVGRIAGGPAGDVIQWRRRGEPVGDQRGDHLAVGQVGAASHRAGPIDDPGDVQPLQHRHHDRQRPGEVTARRRVQPGERGGQVVQRAGVLQAVPAAQVCHNTMADLAVVVPVALHDVHVLVHAAALTHLLQSHIHFPNTLGASAVRLVDPRHPSVASSFPNNIGPKRVRNTANRPAP